MDPIYDSFPASAAGDLSGTVPSNIPEETFLQLLLGIGQEVNMMVM